MARNRKYRTAAARFGPAIKAFLLCLLISCSGIGYVWQKTQIVELGKQIKQREIKLSGLEHENEKMKGQLALMRQVGFLEQKIKTLNLGLAQPGRGQVWSLEEPAAEPVTRGRPDIDPQYGNRTLVQEAVGMK